MITVVVADAGQNDCIWEMLPDEASSSFQVDLNCIPVTLLLFPNIRRHTMRNVVTSDQEHIHFTEGLSESLKHIIDKSRRGVTADAGDWCLSCAGIARSTAFVVTGGFRIVGQVGVHVANDTNF